MLLRVTLPLLAALLAFAQGVAAQDAGARVAPAVAAATSGTPHRTGEFDAILTARSPESEANRWKERFRFGGDLGNWDYDLAGESFSFYVPSDYDPGGEPYGVLVWVSPFEDGGIPPHFRAVLDERRLIWVGANAAGNQRHLFVRAGLALDAAENVERLYNVDPDRIFVSGLSGGGRMAAMLAIDYPEVFAGGFPIIGLTTYLRVPLESSPGLSVPSFPRPSVEVLERAKQQPFVVMTGSGDFNREECRLTVEAHRRDGFTEVHLLDIDGMGHEMPSAEDFARGLSLLLGAPVG